MKTLKELEAFIETIPGSSNGWNSRGGREKFGRYLQDAEGHDEGLEIEGVKFFVIDGKFPAESGGENIWIIFHVEGENTLYRIQGYYTSYDGAGWESAIVEEVEARPRVINDYYPVKK